MIRYVYTTMFLPQDRILLKRAKLPHFGFSRWHSTLYKQIDAPEDKVDGKFLLHNTEDLIKFDLEEAKEDDKCTYKTLVFHQPIDVNKYTLHRRIYNTATKITSAMHIKAKVEADYRIMECDEVVKILLKQSISGGESFFTDVATEALTHLMKKGMLANGWWS